MKKPLNKGGATLQPDLCVVGTGPAGLSLAAAGALLGVSVVLVGEPSRAEERGLSAATLRAAADRAHALRTAFDLGIGRERAEPEIDWAGLRSHMRHVVARDAPMAALDRYRAMGVHVIHETAHFADPATLLAGSTTIRARRFVLAPEGRPDLPAIPGLETVPYLTEDLVLDLAALPRDLLILGAESEAVWLAQTYRRLGSRVTVIAPEERLLKREDPEMVAIVDRSLRREGIDFRLGSDVAFEEGADGGIVARFSHGEVHPEAGHLVLASGRSPVFDNLNLAAAKIRTGPEGLELDHHLRTTNPRVYAVDHTLPLAAQQAGFCFPKRRSAVADALSTRRQCRGSFRRSRNGLRWSYGSAGEGRIHGHPRLAGALRRQFPRDRRPDDRGSHQSGDDAHRQNPRLLDRRGPCSRSVAPWALAMANGLAVSDLAGVALSGPAYSDVGRRRRLGISEIVGPGSMVAPRHRLSSALGVGQRMQSGQRTAASVSLLRHFGLSARLLLLTMLFVMVAEVLIYVPSVVNFRRTWLSDRLAAAQIAALVLDAAAEESLPQELEMRLLAGVGAKAIAIRGGGKRSLLAAGDMPSRGRQDRRPARHVLDGADPRRLRGPVRCRRTNRSASSAPAWASISSR